LAGFENHGGQFSEIHLTDASRAQPIIFAMAAIRAFLRDQSGATAIEYGLIATGISIAIITVVKGLGTKLNSTFSSISTQLK
jgi:pilus assembly protein Flp/PilA